MGEVKSKYPFHNMVFAKNQLPFLPASQKTEIKSKKGNDITKKITKQFLEKE